MSSVRNSTASRDDWQTPDNILRRVFGVSTIGLDPCAPKDGNPTMARLCFSDGGLTESWTAATCDLIYVNPPYSELKKWIMKCELEAERGAEIIALIPSRTDTQAWHGASPDAVAFWKGRLTFRGASAGAPFPSALLYWGHRPCRFGAAFEDAASVVVPL